jgi:hypothetical protein
MQWEPPHQSPLQTDVGEGVDAQLGVASPGYQADKFSYTAPFSDIPETFTEPDGDVITGLSYNVYVTCRDEATPTWGARFHIPQKGHPHLYFSPLAASNVRPTIRAYGKHSVIPSAELSRRVPCARARPA